MCTNFWFDVGYTWIADINSVSVEYFSVFLRWRKRLLNEGIIYRYQFSLIYCRVDWTKVYCASAIFGLFCCFLLRNIIIHYIRIALDTAHINFSNFQIFPLLKIGEIIFLSIDLGIFLIICGRRSNSTWM